jgi:hypothetical protein|tara:strand:+ start:6945 stop:7280 length:336 start_codon:yes stop_codon:yes gene_type:complete
MILDRFKQYLINIEYPTESKGWNISGILKKRSNEHLRYDVRSMSEINEMIAKQMSTASEADKLVFETATYWLVIDNKELKKHVFKHKLKIVYLDTILKELDTWAIEKDIPI